MEYVVKIIADVLAALYQTAGASLLLAALVMCVYMLGRKQGAGPVVRAWIRQFRTSGWFRKHFFLVFYVSMMLFRTLLCRTIWGNPLDHVLGIWSLHNNGELYTENFENLILFLPFIAFCSGHRKKENIIGKKYSGCPDLKFQDQLPVFARHRVLSVVFQTGNLPACRPVL